MIPIEEIARKIRQEKEGVWVADSLGDAVSYPEDGNILCYAIEDDSFWFLHRNDCILETVQLFPPRGTIFDIGGGNGYVTRALQQAGRDVVLVEPGPIGVRNALQRGVRQVVRGTLENSGFVPETIPAMGMFDVLEHIENDESFLRDAHRYLVEGGRLYLTVPAYEWLWSNEDEIAGHFRRYSRSSLSQILDRADFDVNYATYFFHFLPMPSYILRALPHRLGLRAGAELTIENMRAEHMLGPVATAVLGPLMRWELRRIRRGGSLPFGGSCLAVASKRTC